MARKTKVKSAKVKSVKSKSKVRSGKRGSASKAKPAVRRAKAASGKVARARSSSPKQQPIEHYYWPTPNGWKTAIMLEECGLPYTLIPVDISRGDQFKPEFLKISPNNRMPAIIDPDGPGGRPISVFESGAILQYLGRKTGKFYPKDERARVEVDQWLMWQMGGLGPMAGQAHHFRLYAPEQLPYAIERYTNECHRLYGVMNKRLADRPFLAGAYSIADIACVGWASRHERQGQDWAEFPHLKRWFETVTERPAVQKGMSLRVEAASNVDMRDPEVQKVLFGQRAR